MKRIRIIEDDDAIRTELTKNEVRILRCLMQKDVCTREELIEDQ